MLRRGSFHPIDRIFWVFSHILNEGVGPFRSILLSRPSTFLFARLFVTMACALALAACGNTAPRSYRQRVTLTVTTPEGVVSGSSVMEFEVRFQDGYWGGLAGHIMVGGTKGEATVVDLGHRGLLLALLDKDPLRKGSVKPVAYTFIVHPELYEQAQRKTAEDPNQSRREAIYWDLIARLKPHGEVPLDNLSLLIRVRDPKDPRTLERVDPAHLEQAFGPGVVLTSATYAVTDEPVTSGIEKKLPWLMKPNGGWMLHKAQPVIDHTKFQGEAADEDFWSDMR